MKYAANTTETVRFCCFDALRNYCKVAVVY